MSDVIQLLPDAIANQIAAGEVVQRPASVVKELVENAIDAGATDIKVNIKDAGKSVIQVIDNGRGMSETDARLSFERHSTSKIRIAEDLFSIHTLGFRGEALASIAAVAQVELKTKTKISELGTFLRIEGSDFVTQEPVSCQNGCNFTVKNLFFNIPARRKFLKSNTTEFNHIINEFLRVSLCNPMVKFSLIHNGSEIFNLPPSNVRQRIVNSFGKKINSSLITINTLTSIAQITGYIGKPEDAKKKTGDQYFFINNRFMRNPYFHKAVVNAYGKILPLEYVPTYFIYIEADPETIDVNIHPTKTEIKFENQQAIWQILHASVKESLGKNNIVPSLDFNQEGGFDIPVKTTRTEFKPPQVKIDPEYNPFENKTNPGTRHTPLEKDNLENWDKLYESFNKEEEVKYQSEIGFNSGGINDESINSSSFFQFKNKYILTAVKSGLMMIHQQRAFERILFEKYLTESTEGHEIIQKKLFPVNIELHTKDHLLLMEILEEVNSLGFEIRNLGSNSVVVNGMPANADNQNPKELVENLLTHYTESEVKLKNKRKEQIALSIAKAISSKYRKKLSIDEMRTVFDMLFGCSNPNYTTEGKKIINIIATDNIDKQFK